MLGGAARVQPAPDFTMLHRAPYLGCLLAVTLGAGCVEPREAPSVQLPVMVDRSGIVPSRNDKGYEIKLQKARVVVKNIAFAVGGEEHGAKAASGKEQASLMRWLIPTAYAHPGHFEGGEVTGELTGRFILDWLSTDGEPREVGTALLLHGSYTSANFVLGRGGADDKLDPADSLFGHTAVLHGEASKGEIKVKFVAVIDSPKEREVLGIPFTLEVNERTRAPLGFRLHTLGVIEQESMFDGVDFSALELDKDGVARIAPGSQDAAGRRAYSLIRRSFQTQEQFDIKATSMQELKKLASAH